MYNFSEINKIYMPTPSSPKLEKNFSSTIFHSCPAESKKARFCFALTVLVSVGVLLAASAAFSIQQQWLLLDSLLFLKSVPLPLIVAAGGVSILVSITCLVSWSVLKCKEEQKSVAITEKAKKRLTSVMKREGIDRDLLCKKFAFHFFLDRYEGKPGDTHHVPQHLEQYGVFSSYWSSQLLQSYLTDFCASELSHTLDVETIKKLTDFVTDLEHATPLITCLDSYRSAQPELIKAFKTGNVEGLKSLTRTLEHTVSREKIEFLAESSVEKIKQLTPGGALLFLAGSFDHDSLLKIVKAPGGEFYFYIYDLAETVTAAKFYSSEDRLVNLSTWKSLYQDKLSKLSIDEPAWKSFIDRAAEDEAFYTQVRTQKKEVCTLKGLLACLKQALIASSYHSTDSALFEYNKFKNAFGRFIAEKEKAKLELDPVLYSSILWTLEKRTALEEIDQFIFKPDDSAERGILLYCYILKSADLIVPKRTNSVYCDLRKLHHAVLSLFETYPISPEDLSSLQLRYKDPLLNKTIEIFKQRYKQRSKAFKEGFVRNQTLKGPFSSYYLEKISPIGFDSQDLDDYLTQIEKHPNWLERSSPMQAFCYPILLSALQKGKIASFQSIVSKNRGLDNNFSTAGLKITHLFLPESVITFLCKQKDDADPLFLNIYADSAMKLACRDQNIIGYLTLAKRCRKQYFCPFHEYFLKCVDPKNLDKNKIQELINQLPKTPDAAKVSNILNKILADTH